MAEGNEHKLLSRKTVTTVEENFGIVCGKKKGPYLNPLAAETSIRWA